MDLLVSGNVLFGVVFYLVAGVLCGIALGALEAKSRIARMNGRLFPEGELNIAYLISGVAGCLATWGLSSLVGFIAGIPMLLHYPTGFLYLLVLMPVWLLTAPRFSGLLVRRYVRQSRTNSR